MRLSETGNIGEHTNGLRGSAAFKFFLDGRKSENVIVSGGFKESGSWNFFERDMANRVEAFDSVEDADCEFATVHK